MINVKTRNNSQSQKIKRLFLKNLKMGPGVAFVALASLSLSGCSTAKLKSNGKASAKTSLSAKSGTKTMGELKMTQINGGVQVVGWVRNLEPLSVHGFHIHEKGDCSAKDAKSAGGHFNPNGTAHGKMKSSKSHAGDLGNIMADKKGVARVDSFKKGVSLLEGAEAPSIIGKALVVHGGRDDLASQPSGDAGPRIACGVIKR